MTRERCGGKQPRAAHQAQSFQAPGPARRLQGPLGQGVGPGPPGQVQPQPQVTRVFRAKASETVTSASIPPLMESSFGAGGKSNTSQQALNSFKTKVRRMLNNLPDKSVPFGDFVQTYHQMNKHQVKLSDYSCKSLRELLDKIPDVVRTVGKEKHIVVMLANRVEAAEGKKKKTRKSLKKKCPELESNSDILFTFLSSGKTDAVVTLDSDTEEEEEVKASEGILNVTDSEDDETISWTAGESEDSIDDGRDLLQNTPTGLEETFDKTLTLSETAEAEPEASTNVAIFWDIENCPVPKGVSTSDFVSKIRETFCGAGHRELEFRAIHNGKNEKLNEELHELGVDASLSVVGRKNSADEIIKDKMTKFVEAHRESPCTVPFTADIWRCGLLKRLGKVQVHKQVQDDPRP